MVFRKDINLYATAAITGATVYVLMQHFIKQPRWSISAGVAVILIMRLLAIRWEWRLPEFSTKHDADGS